MCIRDRFLQSLQFLQSQQSIQPIKSIQSIQSHDSQGSALSSRVGDQSKTLSRGIMSVCKTNKCQPVNKSDMYHNCKSVSLGLRLLNFLSFMWFFLQLYICLFQYFEDLIQIPNGIIPVQISQGVKVWNISGSFCTALWISHRVELWDIYWFFYSVL